MANTRLPASGFLVRNLIILLSVLLGLFLWLADALLDWLFFYRGEGSFLDMFVLHIPGHEVYVRTLMLVVFTVFGVYAQRIVRRERDSREAAARLARDKNVLMAELHHRVKNNLAVVSSMLAMQISASRDRGVRRVLEQVQGRFEAMALVHKLLYQRDSMATLNLGAYLETFVRRLERLYAPGEKGIVLGMESQAPATDIPMDTAIPLGLIVNELVGNALTHAFGTGGRGHVDVLFQAPAPGELRLMVRDDGTGLPWGFDPAASGGLGFTIIHALAGQIDADLEVTSDARGTSVALTWEGTSP
jgi:two-component sensor histidine kinase